MKKNILSSISVMFLFIMLAGSVMAVSMPSRPNLINDLEAIDVDFRVPVFPMLSVIGADSVLVGQSLKQDFTLEAEHNPDRDYSDLTYSWLFGIWAVMDNSGEIIHQIPTEKSLDSKVYSVSISYNFDEAGTYYYVPAIIEVEQEYRDGEWVVVSEEVIEKEVSKITVIGTPGQPTPTTPIGDFFNRMWSWVLSWFS